MKTGLFWDKISEAERQIIADALLKCSGNKTEAAQELGITRRSFRHLCKKHGVRFKKEVNTVHFGATEIF